MNRTIIPKDCLLCDVCNQQLSDSKFTATEDSYWFIGWLYCMDCKKAYKPEGFLILRLRIRKGDDLSKTELAEPIVMDFD